MFTEVAGAEHEREQAEGDVDEEDPTPRGMRGDNAAEHRTHGRAEHARYREHSRRTCPFVRWEGPVEHRLADRHEHAAAHPLGHAECDQLLDRLRQPTQGRSQREQGQRSQEHPFGADSVTQPPRRRDPNRQAQQVGRDHPLETGVARAETGADGGQRDVHDGHVEHVHEHADHERNRDHALVVPCRRRSHRFDLNRPRSTDAPPRRREAARATPTPQRPPQSARPPPTASGPAHGTGPARRGARTPGRPTCLRRAPAAPRPMPPARRG